MFNNGFNIKVCYSEVVSVQMNVSGKSFLTLTWAGEVEADTEAADPRFKAIGAAIITTSSIMTPLSIATNYTKYMII